MNIDSTDFSNAMQITKGQMGSYDSSGELAKFLEKL